MALIKYIYIINLINADGLLLSTFVFSNAIAILKPCVYFRVVVNKNLSITYHFFFNTVK